MEKEEKLNDEFNNDNIISKMLNHKVLTKEEERKLLLESKNGSIEARNMLVNHNIKLVSKIANNYINRGLEYDDLIQEGILGIIEAINKYDLNKNYKFSSYATWWIHCKIKKALDNNDLIRVSISRKEDFKRIQNSIDELYIKLNRQPTLEEIEKELNFSHEKIVNIFSTLQNCYSLENFKCGEENYFFNKFLQTSQTQEEIVENKLLIEDILNCLKNLDITERDKKIIYYRFGFYGRIYTLEELGDLFNISHERVRCIEKQVLNKIRDVLKINKEKKLKIKIKE